MNRLASVALLLVLASSCATGVYHDRYGTEVAVAPEFWGTVTYVDPYYNRIGINYWDGAYYQPREVYFARGTRWNGLSYSQLRTGDRIWVNGRQHRGRWN